MKARINAKPWPKDGAPVDFADLKEKETPE